MPFLPRVIGRGLLVLVAFAFLAAAFWSFRLAQADLLFRRQTVESVSRAAELTDANADYHRRLGELDDARQRAELRKAVEHNPYDAQARIQLGLVAESDGDYELAERHLLEAALLDRTFVPRWTLTGYYFRRGNKPKFWTSARHALEMSYGDSASAYRLCWRVAEDPLEVLDQAIPATEEHLVRYLLFLIREEKLEAGVEVALRLTPIVAERHRAIVLGYCERLIERRKVRAAVTVWNAMARQWLLSHRQLSPADGQSLTNGNLAVVPIGRGFDWRLLSADGVSASATPGEIAISFTGNQPARCELLLQYLPLAPETDYRLNYTYTTRGRTAEPGLRWQILDTGDGNELAPSGVLLANRRRAAGTLDFRTGAGTGLGRITLRYDKPADSPQLQGSVRIHEVALRLVRSH